MSDAGASVRRVLVAITGASGAVYGWRLLQVLRQTPGVETHLVVSPSGWVTLRHELDLGPEAMQSFVHQLYDASDVGAGPASGSFHCHGMVIAPCSMRSLAAVAHGLADNLITRAADVMLKERRRLVLMARETPLHLGHLRNMTTVTEMGGIICPPMPAFYLRPKSIEDLVDGSIARVMDLLGLPHQLSDRWSGLGHHVRTA